MNTADPDGNLSPGGDVGMVVKTKERHMRAMSGDTRLRYLVLVGLVATLVLAACGEPADPLDAVGGGDELRILVHPDSRGVGGMDALPSGTLVIRDDCVLLEQEPGVAYPVVWPEGTSIARRDPFTLELPSGDELAVGQVVSGAGGTVPASDEQVPVDIPEACLPGNSEEGGEVIVFNAGAELRVFEAGSNPWAESDPELTDPEQAVVDVGDAYIRGGHDDAFETSSGGTATTGDVECISIADAFGRGAC